MKLKIEKFCRILKNPLIIFRFFISKKPFYIIPDVLYLRINFFLHFKKNLNLKTPLTFNEKIQWLKLYANNESYSKLVDKIAVRDYISNTIGSKYLIPLIGTWNSFEEINWEELPNQFVMKTNHDSGGVVICQDKSLIKKSNVRNIINKSLKTNYFYYGREYPYKTIEPKILVEKFMIDEIEKELKDYKLWCFNGKVEFIQVMSDRSDTGFSLNQYNSNWEEVLIPRKSHSRSNKYIKKPDNLNDMIKISEKLSKGFPFLRVDLYEINGDLYFGELTLYPASGFYDFTNYDDDVKYGELIKL